MSAQVHDSQAKFRVNGALLRLAEKKANRQGMSLSEFFRSAVRREIAA